MKADAARLRRAIAAPPADIRLYLLHGPDEAGAATAAAQLARAIGPERERVDLDGAMLRRTPARLAEEAASLSLFGEDRLIRVVAMGDESAPAVELLLDAERDGHPVIALAPTVRSTARIVKLATASPHALVAAFYEPSVEDLERLAAATARDHGLTADPGVARRLAEASGGDRRVLDREIEKLALYLDADVDRPSALDHDALDRLGADLADTALDGVVAAVVEGDPAGLGQALERITAAGASAIPWLRAVERRLLALAAMRADLDGGDGLGDVMKRHRVFFREEAATAAALRRWSPLMVERAVGRLRRAERGVMAAETAGAVIADAVALDLARAVATRR